MSSLTRRFEPGPLPPARMLQGGGQLARVRAWPDDPSMAQLVTLDLQTPPPSVVLRSWLVELERAGFRRVRTGAVSELRTAPYDALGFSVAQRLTLLHLDLQAPRPAPNRGAAPGTRPARPADVADLAELDRSAFPSGWGLDATAIVDAAEATPKSRVRVIREGGRPIAYAVSGRSARAAFLQRLAVDPDHRGRGLGAALVEDSIRWAERWRCRTIAVNTQDDNVTARRLYERAGFVARSHGLVVLERPLGDDR